MQVTICHGPHLLRTERVSIYVHVFILPALACRKRTKEPPHGLLHAHVQPNPKTNDEILTTPSP